MILVEAVKEGKDFRLVGSVVQLRCLPMYIDAIYIFVSRVICFNRGYIVLECDHDNSGKLY